MNTPGLLEAPQQHGHWDAERIAGDWLKTGYSDVTKFAHIKRLQESGVSPSVLAQAVQMADYAVAARKKAVRQQRAAAQAAQEQQFKAKLSGQVV